MATQTDELALFKYNPSTDGESVFSIAQALNENWDKIDTFATAIKSLSNLDAEGEKRFDDIWDALDEKLTAEVSLSENGYIKFNNNVTIQWLHYNYESSSSSGKEFTWPIAFKTAVRGMTKNVASSSSDHPDYYEAFTWNHSKTKFTTGYNGDYGNQFWVMGIGY